jgi:hypothetical protein
MYRQDSAYYSKFATKREEARELLAWEWPKGSFEERLRQQSVKAELDIKSLDAKLEGMGARHTAEYEACMLGQGWQKEWPVDLAAREKARVEDCTRRGRPVWTCK